jgi:hypothetical protein
MIYMMKRPKTYIASSINNAEESIDEHFGQILNEILIHRETLKEVVDKLCDKIFELKVNLNPI